MNRVTGDTQSIQHFIVHGTQETIVQVFTMLIIAIVLFTLDWQLALIVILPTPLYTLGPSYLERGYTGSTTGSGGEGPI